MVLVCKVEPAPGASLIRIPQQRVKSNDDEEYGKIVTFFQRVYRKTSTAWYRIQIGNRGYYSVERLLAFRDYRERTSLARVIAVCLLSPIPTFVTMMLLDCIPLKDPEAGWKANWAMWIRLLFSSFFIAGGAVFQAKDAIVEGAISNTRTIMSAAMTAICYTGISMAVAANWGYPIPFGVVIMVIPFTAFTVVFFLLGIGPRLLSSSTKLRTQLMAHLLVVSTEAILAVAYPTLSAIFTQLSGPQQSVFVFFFPVIKFIIKQVIARVSNTIHECVGPVIVFSVDVFNVLYLVICMQTARTSLTTILVIATDACHIALALRTIHYNTNSIMSRNEHANRNPSRYISPDYLERVTSMVHEAFDESKRYNTPHTGRIRVFAPFKLSVSIENKALLDELASTTPSELTSVSTLAPEATKKDTGLLGSACYGPFAQMIAQEPEMKLGPLMVEHMKSTSNVNRAFIKPNAHQIGPEALSSDPTLDKASTIRIASRRTSAMRSSKSVGRTSSRRKSSVLVSPSLAFSHLRRASLIPPGASPPPETAEEIAAEGLQVLFHCEYIVMAEYVECVLPLLYTVYLLLLIRMPTAIYYPHTQHLSPGNSISTLSNLLIYGALEFLSFIGLHVLLKRRFGYSPAYQLAFVLESQAQTVQGLLFVWMIFILQLTLVHYGTNA